MLPHSPNQTNLTAVQQEPDEHQLPPEIIRLIREKIQINRVLVAIPTVLFLFTILGGMVSSDLFIFFLFGTICSLGVISLMTRIKKDNFKLKYRQTIVDGILRCVFNQIVYEPNSYLRVKEFYSSGLSEKFPNVYQAENYIKLNRPNYDLEMCYVYAARQSIRNNDDQTAYSYLVHIGLFLKYTIPVLLPVDIIVLRDKSRDSLINFNSGPENIFNKFNRVPFTNALFEKEFQVYGENTEKTIKFMDKSIQEFLLETRAKLGDHVQVSFLDDSIYLTLYHENDLFKPGFLLFSNGRFIKKNIKEAQWLFGITEYLHPYIEKLVEKYRVS